MAEAGQHVYATLLLSDSYLPGALVLAHSLRDAGTDKELAVLVTLDSVSAEAITQLQTVFNHVLPVPRIRNSNPANLYLMNRADLHSAFTKINLWKLTQFSKVVYIDADVVAYRAPDELFAIPRSFSAAPDIGWPDIFNTGVMVLTPNMGDYYALMAMAERGISFDGADQGLLNTHFQNTYHRLSFTYNVTPSPHYQYLPAYRHFQSSINMVHFIGSDKPWLAGRQATIGGNSPFQEMAGRWWAVYDRHFRQREIGSSQSLSASELVQYLTRGEFQPPKPTLQPSQLERLSEPAHQQYQDQSTGENQLQHSFQPLHSSHDRSGHYGRGDDAYGSAQASDSAFPPPVSSERDSNVIGTSAETSSEKQELQSQASGSQAEEKSEHHPISVASWDAQRQPPPLDSKPEAMNFPALHYEMSSDTKPFVPPLRYPSPPKDMWYEVPKEKPAAPTQAPKPLFPWETNKPRPSRSFAGDPIRTVDLDSSTPPQTKSKKEPITPTTPTIKVTPSDAWDSFNQVNAWDEHPQREQINRVVESLPWHRRMRSQPSAGGLASSRKGPATAKGHGLRLTDFPSAFERPSLPVTPAPVTREGYWGDEGSRNLTGGAGTGAAGGSDAADSSSRHQPLPAAEGVPQQSEWVCAHGRRWQLTDCLCDQQANRKSPFKKDPQAQLQILARQQSEALLRKLGGLNDEGEMQVSREIPQRPLPYGSELETSSAQPRRSVNMHPVVHSPRPVKADAATGNIRRIWSNGEYTVTNSSPKNVSFATIGGGQGEPSAAERTPYATN